MFSGYVSKVVLFEMCFKADFDGITDGVEVECILVNNEFPGPIIEANWGDMVG
jgi:hypothetical protein